MSAWRCIVIAILVAGMALAAVREGGAVNERVGWKRHTIDASSRGADGVRLADANRDGLPDIATGWEEGGRVRVCLNPGPAKGREPWPAVTVGEARAVEDAVLVDLDADGAMDVVSCSEGGTRAMFVHWAPTGADRYLDPSAWRTEALPSSRGMMMWMYCVPMEVDGKHGVDLVAGGKGPSAALGWWESPANPRELDAWTWHAIRPVGWLMSLVAEDMDGDGDRDVAFSDRKGKATGCFWLENTGAPGGWPEHPIGGQGQEAMFLRVADVDGDGLRDVAAALRPRHLLVARRLDRTGRSWASQLVPLPANAGGAKAVSTGDLTGDGVTDLVFTCEGADGGKSGVMFFAGRRGAGEITWTVSDISGSDGIKHDLVELLDLDADGDLDVLTCEETRNLGVFWYENPRKHP